MPPPELPHGSLAKRILIGLVATALVVVGVLVIRPLLSGGAANAQVGDCVKVTKESGQDVQVDVMDCSDQQASYRVAKTLDSSSAKCPSTEYSEVYKQGGSASSSFKLCLIPNARTGDCFDDAGRTTVKTACRAGLIEVTDVIEGRVDESACTDKFLTFPEPAITICVKMRR